jgi:hypothetical protein
VSNNERTTNNEQRQQPQHTVFGLRDVVEQRRRCLELARIDVGRRRRAALTTIVVVVVVIDDDGRRRSTRFAGVLRVVVGGRRRRRSLLAQLSVIDKFRVVARFDTETQ